MEGTPTDPGASCRDGELARFELNAAAATLVATFMVAQVVHIWTLRNMIVVVPSLSWGIVWGLIALPRAETGRRIVAGLLLLAMLGSLGPIAHDLQRPYKTDWRSAMLQLAALRAQHPKALFSFFMTGGPTRYSVATDREPRDPYVLHIYDRVEVHGHSRSDVERLSRVPGPQAVVYYSDVTGEGDAKMGRLILTRLHDPACRQVPIHGLVLVSCT